MSYFICTLDGVKGRVMDLYDNKCVIKTDVTAGSLLANNAKDGEKTIFFIDIIGIQFKESGAAIGFLQLETATMQMNNLYSNLYSENSFTFEAGKNHVTNTLMSAVYEFICDRVEGFKYGTNTAPLTEIPEKILALLPKNLDGTLM